MPQFKRIFVLFGILAVVMTVSLFLYWDEVSFDKFLRRAKFDEICTNDLDVDGRNYMKITEDFFDRRKVG